MTVRIVINGEPHDVPAGTTVAAALWNLERVGLRRSPRGEPRGVFCAMGVCHECRVRVNGRDHCRACVTEVAPGMEIEVDV